MSKEKLLNTEEAWQLRALAGQSNWHQATLDQA